MSSPLGHSPGLGLANGSGLSPSAVSATSSRRGGFHPGSPGRHSVLDDFPAGNMDGFGSLPVTPRAPQLGRAASFGRSSHVSHVSDLDESLLDGEEPQATHWYSLWVTELRSLLYLAYPLTASFFLGFCVNLFAIASVGSLGGPTMSAVVLATSFYSVTGMAVAVGFAGVLETTCGQAYGARAFGQVGTALQRGFLTGGLLCLAVTSSWIPARQIFTTLGQSGALSAEAARYLHILAPCLPLQAASSLMSRYLAAQGASRLTAVAPAVAAAAAPLFLTYGVHVAGADGAAAGLVATYLLSAATMVAAVCAHERRMRGDPAKCWRGWTQASLRGWGLYVKLGIPSLCMVLAEWGAFETCTLATGLLPRPDVDLAAMGICQNLTSLLYMVPLGIAQSASVRVSHNLGGGSAAGAKRASRVSTTLVLSLQLVLASLIYFFRELVIAGFTSDPEVRAIAKATFLYVALGLPFDGFNCVSSGCLRGAGRQAYGAYLFLISYWIIGLPLGFTLAFKFGYGVPGIFAGLSTGTAAQSLANFVLFSRINWRSEAARVSAVVAEQQEIFEALQREQWVVGIDDAAPEGQDAAPSPARG